MDVRVHDDDGLSHISEAEVNMEDDVVSREKLNGETSGRNGLSESCLRGLIRVDALAIALGVGLDDVKDVADDTHSYPWWM